MAFLERACWPHPLDWVRGGAGPPHVGPSTCPLTALLCACVALSPTPHCGGHPKSADRAGAQAPGQGGAMRQVWAGLQKLGGARFAGCTGWSRESSVTVRGRVFHRGTECAKAGAQKSVGNGT